MQPVWQAQTAALTGELVSPREGGSRGRDPTGRLGRERRAGCTVLSSGARGTSIPGRASRRGSQDHHTPRTSTRERPPGPLRLQDGHLGGSPRTTMPPGRAPRSGPQDHCAPGTTAPQGWELGRGPQDHCTPGTGIWEGPLGPPHPQDEQPGGAPTTTAPLGPLCPQDGHLEGAPRTTAPLGRASWRGPPGITVLLVRREAAQVALSALHPRHSS